MRVFTALLMHESSSFSPLPTTLDSYRDSLLYQPGEDPWNEMAETMDSQADFVRLATASGHTVIRGLMADTAPGSPAPLSVYQTLRNRILDQVTKALPLDIVLLTLHGAQMADGCDDCEGDLLAHLRERVGPGVTIAVELDLHFNLTESMVRNATLINACMEYPHVDVADRAQRLYGLAERAAKGEIHPVMAWCRVPLMGQFFTTREPMRSLVRRAEVAERQAGVLSVSLGHGFPHADSWRTGASVLVAADRDLRLARQIAQDLARDFFAIKEAAAVPLVSIDRALEIAGTATRLPIVIADGSDNPGGGAPCDSTFLLRAMLDAGMGDSVVAWIVDPEAVSAAVSAGVGASIRLSMGGKHGNVSGPPVSGVVRVIKVARDFKQVGLGCCADTELGDAAVVAIEGIEVVLVSRRNQPYGPESLRKLGIQVESRRAIVLKSSQHFHTHYHPIAAEIVYADADGALTQRFEKLPYKHLVRPIWPLDDLSELPAFESHQE